MSKVTLFWFRRDLRIEDNVGLYYALKDGHPVQAVFIFDTEILDKLDDKNDARVDFIHREISRINEELTAKGTTLDVRIGRPKEVWNDLIEDYDISCVYANNDYEPYARERDKFVNDLLDSHGIKFVGKKDHVIFEKNDVLKDDGKPYVVYTPFSHSWKERLAEADLLLHDSEKIENWHQSPQRDVPTLESFGFKKTKASIPPRIVNRELLKNYHKTRDIPGIKGTSRLSVHLRFGTISIRQLARQASAINMKYFNELIWREFYQMILWHFPHVVEHNFKKQYDLVKWRDNEEDFHHWCQGKTGFPIVDAGMRELNETGYMHNRVRMITASFLCKDLLTDWRWGEAYFAAKLLDYELASNNGGWQWAAGTGVDAAPYFRIFNPISQQQKFDPKFDYIKKWIPEFGTDNYPQPIVGHVRAREKALAAYKGAFNRIRVSQYILLPTAIGTS